MKFGDEVNHRFLCCGATGREAIGCHDFVAVLSPIRVARMWFSARIFSPMRKRHRSE
jgi:hypothetical protein